MEQLFGKIEQLTNRTGGEWGVVLKDLQTEEMYEMNSLLSFNAASVIKVPIMAAVFQGIENGRYQLSDKLTLTEAEQVGGAGVLQHMTPGTRLTLEDLMVLMIIQSDNTATNMIIELIGISYINEFTESLGMKSTILYNKLMLPPENRKGPLNQTTARDQVLLLEKMHRGTLVSKPASKHMLKIMKQQQITDRLPHLLRYDYPREENPVWELGHKTGSISKHRHDVGILYVNNRSMIVSVLARDAHEWELEKTIAKIGKVVFEYLFED